MIESFLQQLQANYVAAWGAALSTLLGFVKLYEVFWKDRIRLQTTYSFTSERGADSEITLVNLSPVPVQVADWSLVWVPRWWCFWRSRVNVTPDEAFRFKIDGRDEYTLSFGEESSFQWGGGVAVRRRLILTLRVFGKSRPVKLKVY